MVEAVACKDCPLRKVKIFKAHSGHELSVIAALRSSQQARPAGTTLIAEGQSDAPLYTLFAGWAFRYKSLPDGRRQILNFLLPGDFIGLQHKVVDGATHGVEALTEVWLCTFKRDAVWALHRDVPELGFDVTWLAAHEESVVDEHLLSVGRRSAQERVAMLLLILYKRAAAVMPSLERGIPFPLTQQHIADALGLSLVHTHRTLRQLEKRGLHTIEAGWLKLPNPTALQQLAALWDNGRPTERPLI